MAKTRSVSALCAFFVLTLVLAACGGGIPGDAVVKVSDRTIKKTTFQHWLKVAAISSAGQTGAAPAQVQIPVPPDFTACVATKRKTAPKPAKGQPLQTDVQFKAACKTQYETLRDQVLQFLISAEWIAGETAAQHVTVTDAAVKKQFDATKKQSFPTDAAFATFLKTSGYTINDLTFQVRNQQLSTALRTKITKGKNTVTPAQIQSYYAKNKARFGQPERRDLRIILTKTEADARRAQAQVNSGVSFAKVAKALSIDQNSKSQGGVLLAIAKGQQEKALDDAVFAAPKGKLTGPVKTNFGYYVFRVQKITTATQQTFQQASPTIKQLLSAQNQQTALDTFVKDFQKRWRGRTECRDGFKTSDCNNGPKPATTPAGVPPTSGQTPTTQSAPVTP